MLTFNLVYNVSVLKPFMVLGASLYPSLRPKRSVTHMMYIIYHLKNSLQWSLWNAARYALPEIKCSFGGGCKNTMSMSPPPKNPFTEKSLFLIWKKLVLFMRPLNSVVLNSCWCLVFKTSRLTFECNTYWVRWQPEWRQNPLPIYFFKQWWKSNLCIVCRSLAL